MNRRSFLTRLLFCAGLMGLAAPLRAGKAIKLLSTLEFQELTVGGPVLGSAYLENGIQVTGRTWPSSAARIFWGTCTCSTRPTRRIAG